MANKNLENKKYKTCGYGKPKYDQDGHYDEVYCSKMNNYFCGDMPCPLLSLREVIAEFVPYSVSYCMEDLEKAIKEWIQAKIDHYYGGPKKWHCKCGSEEQDEAMVNIWNMALETIEKEFKEEVK